MQLILRIMHGNYFSHASPFYMDIVPAEAVVVGFYLILQRICCSVEVV